MTREELLAASDARPDELAVLEADGLLVPNRSPWPWRRREVWYTETQIQVLRHLAQNRRRATTRGGGQPTAATTTPPDCP